jgi:beta-xylosidase
LFYSTNDFRSPDYRVGVAVADSIFGPYKKLQNAPVIARENTGLNGSGHGDVFFDDKGHMWYVFHAHHSNIEISPRRAVVVKLIETVGKDGYPRYKIDYKTMRLL